LSLSFSYSNSTSSSSSYTSTSTTVDVDVDDVHDDVHDVDNNQHYINNNMYDDENDEDDDDDNNNNNDYRSIDVHWRNTDIGEVVGGTTSATATTDVIATAMLPRQTSTNGVGDVGDVGGDVSLTLTLPLPSTTFPSTSSLLLLLRQRVVRRTSNYLYSRLYAKENHNRNHHHDHGFIVSKSGVRSRWKSNSSLVTSRSLLPIAASAAAIAATVIMKSYLAVSTIKNIFSVGLSLSLGYDILIDNSSNNNNNIEEQQQQLQPTPKQTTIRIMKVLLFGFFLRR